MNADLAAIEARHRPLIVDGWRGKLVKVTVCASCFAPWPCDTRRLLDKLADAHKTIRALVAPTDFGLQIIADSGLGRRIVGDDDEHAS